MKIHILILILFSSFIFAQNQRFTYEYRFIPDSANREDVKTEIMDLDVSKTGSRFYSETVYKSDSAMKVDLEKQLQATGAINVDTSKRKGDVRYSVSKTYPGYGVFFHNKILMDGFKVKEDRKISWNILPEKMKIGEWNAQKAETNFGGRKWTAWFTPEIPIQDGPYKFYGLPGMIVKLEDQTLSHRFELKGVSKISEIPVDSDVFKLNEIEVSRKQYEKLLKDYENDPAKGLKMLNSSGNIILTDKNGNSDKLMREREEAMKAKIRKNNNQIELIQ